MERSTGGAAVRWGFLGAGWVATRALAPAMRAARGASLQAVAAREVERARSLEPAGAAYGGYEDLLADDAVDAVYISLTNDVHAHWSIAAMRAGKHVLCEKPLAMTAAEVREMAAVAEETGRLLVEASWYRWHPRVQLAERLVAEGRVGAVRHAAAGFVFAGQLAGNYRLEVARGGGALYDVGCYAVSAVQWAFGNAPVRDVVARQDRGETGVDLVTEAVLSFDAGEAEVRAGISESPRQWLVVTGERGEIELRDAAYTSWKDDETLLLVSDGARTDRVVVPAANPYVLMVEAVGDRICGGDAWVLPVEQSLATAEALDAAFASARDGSRPVVVRRR